MRGSFRARRVDGLAVSRKWVAYRTRADGRDQIRARRIFRFGIGSGQPVDRAAAAAPPAGGPSGAARLAFGSPRMIAASRAQGGLSRPAIYRRVLVYSRSNRRRSAVIELLLGSGHSRTLVRSRRWLVSEPSVWARSFAYVQSTNERQQLLVRRRHGRGAGRVVLSLPAISFRDRDHDRGRHRLPTRLHRPDLRRTDWSLVGTAIAPGRVYATVLRNGPAGVRARILRTGR